MRRGVCHCGPIFSPSRARISSTSPSKTRYSVLDINGRSASACRHDLHRKYVTNAESEPEIQGIGKVDTKVVQVSVNVMEIMQRSNKDVQTSREEHKMII